MRFALMLAIAASLTSLSVPADADTNANKTVASRVFLEKMGKGDFSKLDEIYGPGFTAHSGTRSFTLDEDNASGKAIRAAVPDLEVLILRMVAESDFVTVHWRARGTNSVAAGGMPGTGKTADVEGMTIFRFVGGRIVEEWSLTDRLALLRQLGQP